MLKKGDFLIYGIILTAAAVCILLNINRKNGNTVTVRENGNTVYSGSVYTDKTVKLTHNTVKIKGGNVSMDDSDCKNQICVNHNPINKKDEIIVCLPNKVTVEIS